MSSRTSDLKDLAPVCIMPAEKHGKRSRQAPLESDLMCCINELPDEMLMNILSNLEVKEAAKTSVLSRKWRNLWTFSANLDFDRTWKKLWKKLWENLEIDVRDLWMLYSDTKRQKHGVHKFMESVSNVLDRHRGSTLDRLRIAFNMHFYCPCIEQYVAKWVDFALVKRVRILELDLTSASGSDVSESACAFPSWLLSIPLDLPCFDRLTALCLNSVSISDAELAYFLSSCPLLEQLSVRNARGLKNVRVSGVALTLNRLEIGSNYVCDQLESVEICAPNLTSFKYGWCREPTVKMCLTDVPKLAWISLRNSSCEHSIVKFHNDLCLSRMKKLELDLRSMDHDRCLQFPRSFPELNNLEDLGLKFIVREDENLLFLNSIIAASPCLQKLTMEYNMHKAYSKLEDLCEELGGGFTHQCLQVIQFVGWNGVQTEVQLADYLIKSAPQLEKLILDLRIPESKQTEAGWMSEDYHYSERNWQGRADALLCAKQFEINFQKRFPKARLIIVHRLQSSDTETTSIS